MLGIAQVLTSCHMLVLVVFCCLTHLILRLFRGLGALVVVLTFLHVSKIINMQHGTGANVLLPTSGFLLFETLTFCL